jgi:hypothetical protein
MGNIVQDYIAHGWQVVAIPAGTKGPTRIPVGTPALAPSLVRSSCPPITVSV